MNCLHYPYPCTVKLVRVSPKKLDTDNLVTAFKHIRDTIADNIRPGLARGQADADEKIVWMYDQKKGGIREYAIEIDIYE